MPLDEQSPPKDRVQQDKPQQGKPDQDREQQHESRRQRARPFVRIGLGLLVLIAVIGGVWYWWSTRNEVGTDDAYTDGFAIGMAPHVNGYIASLDVTDNQFVHRGDPLIHIDPRDYIAARNQAQGALEIAQGQYAGAVYGAAVARKNFPARLAAAQANYASAQANLFKAQTDYQRQIKLPHAATTQQEVDAATANLRAAEAQVAQTQADVHQAEPVEQNIGQSDSLVKQLDGQVKQATAQLAQAELNLGWTVVTAPSDGWVTKRAVEGGSYVQQGQQIMSLVEPDVWITANFKETQLNHMRPGQPVTINVDAYPGLKLRGHVDSVQLGSGAKFTAFPPENATGNFVKIVQRVPVKIVIDSGLDPAIPLPLGISVEPTVTVK
jgi:membrane fusion protein (multidrug efflux system)